VRFSLYIAKRYLFTKSRNNAINIITGIAATGVVVGALALFVVLSGFSGLKDFSLQFTSVFDPDLKVAPKTGKTFFLNASQQAQLENTPDIIAYAPAIEERVFLNFRERNTIAHIKGVQYNYQNVVATDSILAVGEWFSQDLKHVVIGSGISNRLSLGVFDYSETLELYVPTTGTGQITDPSKAFRKERTMVSGIYHVTEELNNKYVFAPFELSRVLLNYGENEISFLEVKLSETAKEKEVVAFLETLFHNEVTVKNRVQQNDALYKMLNSENLAVYLIFTLVLIIALFNVVGSIIMMILDKKHNAKTLFNLGATLKEIRRVFFLQGVLMTFLGGLLGLTLGLLLVFLQQQFSLVMITSSLPYPVKVEWQNVLIVFFTINILGILASKIAASRVNEGLLVNH
jgi:lipoprotein-releasing system permease protein